MFISVGRAFGIFPHEICVVLILNPSKRICVKYVECFNLAAPQTCWMRINENVLNLLVWRSGLTPSEPVGGARTPAIPAERRVHVYWKVFRFVSQHGYFPCLFVFFCHRRIASYFPPFSNLAKTLGLIYETLVNWRTDFDVDSTKNLLRFR